MPVFRSKPLARRDSVDVIIGRGIVLELPNGFGSLASNDKNILHGRFSLISLCYKTSLFFLESLFFMR